MKNKSFSNNLDRILFFLKSHYNLIKVFFREILDFKKTELKSEGIVIYSNYLDKETTNELLNRVKFYEKNPKKLSSKTFFNIRDSSDSKQKYDTGMIDIVNYHKTEKKLINIIDVKRIQKIIEEQSNSKINFKGLNIYINKGIENTRSFHVDSFGANQVKAFIYLSDVLNESYGPYCYVKKSNLLSFEKFKNLYFNFFKGYPLTDIRNFNKKEIYKCIAKKGTLIISCQDGYHRGHPQEKNKERYLITINFIG